MKFINFALILSLFASAASISPARIPKHTTALIVAKKESKLNAVPVLAPPVKNSAFKTLAPILAASFCAAAIMYPLDLVRALQMANSGSGTKLTTLQLLSNFKSTHGWQGFFTQGLVPELARATWMRFVKFGLFPIIHLAITNGIPEGKGNSQSKAMSAILTSFPEVISIMPLEIAKIALQLDSEKLYNNNMFKAMGAIFKSQGINAFKAGYVGVQYRQAAWSSAYFVSLPFFEKKVDEIFKSMGIDTSKIPSAKTSSQLISGFCAGVFGASLNTPGDTIRTVVQKRILGNLDGAKTFLGVGSEIVNSRGAGALYAGFGFKAIHLGGGGALMAFFVPFFKKLFGTL
eukprot:gene10646-22226_t